MKMSTKRRDLFRGAIDEGRGARREGRFEDSLRHFERAHVIGQRWIGPHLISHWEMLRVGWRTWDLQEIVGQIFRLALVLPGTWLRRLPEGNTGGANVNPFQPMAIDEGLGKLLEEADAPT